MPDDAVDPAQGLCTELPLEVGVKLFVPVSQAGLVQRTSRWPGADSHEGARRYCPRCPALSWCLREALDVDGHTFRGLSPEERAAVGGRREKAARKRPPYLSVAEVAGRVLDSGYPVDVVVDVLAAWDARVESDPSWAKGRGLSTVQAGWTRPYRDGRVDASELLAGLAEPLTQDDEDGE